MIAPLTFEQANAVHELQCRARALNVPCELHFTLDWRVLIRVGGDEEFETVDEAAAYLSGLETAR